MDKPDGKQKKERGSQAIRSLLHAVVGSSARQAHRLDIFSKSLGQIQNLDPDHLMSALKSRTAPGDTLPRSAILLSTPGSKRWMSMVMADDDLRMKDKPHQLRRLSIRWSSSSNDMPRDGSASNSASRRRASAIPSSSSCRTDGSDPSRCAARTALSVSGKSSASFSTSAMVAIRGSLVSTVSKARTHQKTAT